MNLRAEMKLHPSMFFCPPSQFVSVVFFVFWNFPHLTATYLPCAHQHAHRPDPPYFVLLFVFYGTLQLAYQRTEDTHKVVNKAKLAAFSN